jgi:hypothetical protein
MLLLILKLGHDLQLVFCRIVTGMIGVPIFIDVAGRGGGCRSAGRGSGGAVLN